MIALVSNGEKEHYEAVLHFLENIEQSHVRGVVMVAICDDGPYLSWDCSAADMAVAASVVQAQATLNYMGGMEDEDFD